MPVAVPFQRKPQTKEVGVPPSFHWISKAARLVPEPDQNLMSSKPEKTPEVPAWTDEGLAKEDKQQSPASDILTAQDFFMDLHSGEGQNRPHGMRASGLSPFIFAMRVSPFRVKGAR